MGSENCAGAARGTQVVLKLELEEGAPGEDRGEDLVRLRVVRRRHNVAFLAAAHVDAAERLVGNDSRGVIAEAVDGVDTSHGHSLLCRGVTQLDWTGASGVADQSSDAARRVRVRLLMERDAD